MVGERCSLPRWLAAPSRSLFTALMVMLNVPGNPLQPATGTEGVDRYGWLGRQQREWDPEVGLTLMGVRGYDPVLGRFLSVDPLRGRSAND